MSVREIHLANTSDLRAGEMKEISVDERKILLARVGDNFHAVGATCPHYGGPLAEGVLCGTRVICPWHHAAFNVVTGDLEDPPALDSLVRYDLRVEGDRILLRLPHEDEDQSAEDRRTPAMSKRDSS